MVTVTIKLSSVEAELIRELAKEQGTSIPSIIKDAIFEYISKGDA